MTTTQTAGRIGYIVDRTGSPRFISRKAADAWLATGSDNALQCPDPGCGEISYESHGAFECCGQGAAIPVRPVAGDAYLFETVPVDQLAEPVVAAVAGTSRTTGRNAKGQFASWDAIRARVTVRGHWYRSDDGRDVFSNDTVCRGCLAHGHFDYILDRIACPNPASEQDIAVMLAARPLSEPLVARR